MPRDKEFGATWRRAWWVAALGALLMAACTQAPSTTETPAGAAVPTLVFGHTYTPLPTATATVVSEGLLGPVEERLIGSDERPRFSQVLWRTNLKKRTVRLDEIFSGGVGRDGIPPIYAPQFLTISEAEEAMTWLRGRHPVAVAELNGEVKAYPIGIMTYHEVVNDVLGGVPVLITY